jgi:hypothetical protein
VGVLPSTALSTKANAVQSDLLNGIETILESQELCTLSPSMCNETQAAYFKHNVDCDRRALSSAKKYFEEQWPRINAISYNPLHNADQQCQFNTKNCIQRYLYCKLNMPVFFKMADRNPTFLVLWNSNEVDLAEANWKICVTDVIQNELGSQNIYTKELFCSHQINRIQNHYKEAKEKFPRFSSLAGEDADLGYLKYYCNNGTLNAF